MRIGYQGIPGSNSDAATDALAARAGVAITSKLGCGSSAGVARALRAGEVDGGVLAIRNSSAGEVQETAEALAGLDHVVVATIEQPIEHCLFTLGPAPVADLRRVYSHPQALAQCGATLRARWPSAEPIPMRDTALAARCLAEGAYGPGSAAIARYATGEALGLVLVARGIQDSTSNRTTFVLIRLPGASPATTDP